MLERHHGTLDVVDPADHATTRPPAFPLRPRGGSLATLCRLVADRGLLTAALLDEQADHATP